MTTREHDVRLADGRTLRVQDSGATEAPTVVFFHGTPGCGLLHDRWLAAAAAAGLRLLAYDRPGYGGSTPQPDRTVADAAADVAALADQLQVGRFAVWGASGGGPHALACAALLPDRVVAAAVAASPAPYDAPGLDWFAGLAELHVQRFKLALAGREALQPVLAQSAQALLAADPAQLIALSGPVLSPPDRAVFDTDLAAFLLAVFRDGLAAGAEGWVEDDLAFVAAWGVALDKVRVPVAAWHGGQDLDVPATHGRWLAGAIPGAELRLLPDDGHVSLIFAREREVVGWLAEQLRRAAEQTTVAHDPAASGA
jgi:pimeloyl-ACP methyl ester carboxylesterase